MKLQRNPRLLTGMIGVAGLLTIAGAATAIHAASASTTGTNSLVQMIADKFHLNVSDVQQVFDQNRANEQANRQAKAKEFLDAAVKDGKITQAQEDLITAKQAEIQTFMDSLKDKSAADRKTAMQTEMTQVAQWAKDNGISEKYLHLGGPGGPGGHRGGPMKDDVPPADPGADPAPSSSPTASSN